MKRFLLILALAAALFGSWYFASPWWAMKNLRDAAMDADTQALSEQVDFPALRESVKSQMQVRISEDVAREGSIVGMFGEALAGRASDLVVDRLVTPENVGALLVSGGLAASMIPERLRGQKIHWDVVRMGIDRFEAIGTFEDGTSGPRLVFVRNGLGWRLSAVELLEAG